MMKKLKQMTCVSLMSVLLSTSFSYANLNENTNMEKIQNAEISLLKYKNIAVNDIFNIKLKNINENTEFFKSDIRYPCLKIENKYLENEDFNIKGIENINKIMRDYSLNFKEKIKEESKDYKKQYEDIFSKSKEKYMKYQYEAYSDYKVTYNKNNLISIPMKLYEFTGGAHGMSYLKAFNYDLISGKEIKLKDMFKKDINYKTIIDKYIKQQIQENKDIYFNEEQGFKGISDNQSFYIEEDGIVVYFGLYEIAPYYVGIPKFKLTWDQFGQYLNYNK